MKYAHAARPEHERAAALRAAQDEAFALLDLIERDLLRPGKSERELEKEIRDLAAERFGVSKHWHKRIVRAGANTLCPYDDNPPDLMIGDDDIVFLDLGPVFGEWEADVGRTYALGDDPVKRRLCADIVEAFEEGKQYFKDHPGLTGDAFFRFAQGMAAQRGWEFGGPIAGHIVGEFPHHHLPDDKISFYISPDNKAPLDAPDGLGQKRHWILEIHFVDRQRQIGGFHEALITID